MRKPPDPFETIERDGTVRFRILRALSKLRVADPTLKLDRRFLSGITETTLKNSFRLIDWRLAIERFAAEDSARNTPALQLIATLLRDKESHAIGRIFLLLGLLHPRENFDRIMDDITLERSGLLFSVDAKQRGTELLAQYDAL